MRHVCVQILITPALVGLAESMRVVTKGLLSKSLKVEFQAIGDGSDDVCEI